METNYDIYVSYAFEDRDKVRTIVNELEWAGLRVWWQDQPVAGDESIRFLEGWLDESNVHLVVWSQNSAASGRVQAEARVGARKGRLVATRIEQVIPPRDTTAVVYADLGDWRGGQDHRGATKMFGGIWRLIGKGVKPPENEPPPVPFAPAPKSEVDGLSEDQKDERAWDIAIRHDTETYYKFYLERFPYGIHAQEARTKIEKKGQTGKILVAVAIGFGVLSLLINVIIIAMG